MAQGTIMLNVNRISFKFCLIVSLITFNFSSIGAQTTKSTVIKVGFMNSIKRVNDGHYVGVLPDIVRETIHNTDYSLVLQAMPIKRLLKSLETGRIDAVIGLFKRDDRLVYSDYLELPIGWVCANMFRLKSNIEITSDPASLRHKNIGLLRGANWGQALKDVLIEQKVYQTTVSNYNMLAKMLHKGRFDAVIASSEAFKSAARKQNLDEDYVAMPLKYTTKLGMYILVSKKSPLANNGMLVEQLNRSLLAMKEANLIDEIYQRNGKTFDEHCTHT